VALAGSQHSCASSVVKDTEQQEGSEGSPEDSLKKCETRT